MSWMKDQPWMLPLFWKIVRYWYLRAAAPAADPGTKDQEHVTSESLVTAGLAAGCYLLPAGCLLLPPSGPWR